MKPENAAFTHWFRSAAPYIHQHSGRTFVLYVDGALLLNDTRLTGLVQDLALLNSLQICQVLVFGVRPQIEQRLARRGLDPHFVRGLRVTDGPTLECVTEAVGHLRLQLEALLSMGLPNTPMAGASVRVSCGNFVMAQPVGVLDGIDCGHTGKVRRIDADAIRARLAENCIVLVPPLGYSLSGELFHLSAAETAAYIARRIKAHKLLFLLPGRLNDADGQLIRELSSTRARALLRESPQPLSPLLRCLQLGLEACEEGVERVHIIDQQAESALLQELFSRDGSAATLLSVTDFDHVRKAQIGDIGGILALIEPLLREGTLAPRTRSDVEQQLGSFTVAVRDGTIIACAMLRIDAKQRSAGIECLVVHPEYHGQGKGELLCRHLEQEARQADVQHLYALTTQATHWFLERGFVELASERLPAGYRGQYQPVRNSKTLYRDLSAP